MITSNVGKLFLDAYNKKTGKQYNAKQFFIEVFYPLFFDHNKYMMTGGNSALENPKIKWKDMILNKIPFETKEKRKERFNKFVDKIAEGKADASVAIGYPAMNELASTSGQVSNNTSLATEDEAYLSWMGAGLGVGVEGGQVLLFLNEKILLDIFEGWKFYREYLENNDKLDCRQVTTWNGQWLAYRYSDEYNPSLPQAEILPENDKDLLKIPTISWVNVLLGITIHSELKLSRLLAYIYNIGQTNTTYGFIPFILGDIKKPYKLYEKYFGIINKDIVNLWGLSLGKACEDGIIGVKAMKPDKLESKFNEVKNYKGKSIKVNELRAYISWVMAMLNNEELWNKAEVFAKELKEYVKNSVRATTGRQNKVENILKSCNKKSFIGVISEIKADFPKQEMLYEICKIVNDMPYQNVGYFIILIKFHYIQGEKQ